MKSLAQESLISEHKFSWSAGIQDMEYPLVFFSRGLEDLQTAVEFAEAVRK